MLVDYNGGNVFGLPVSGGPLRAIATQQVNPTNPQGCGAMICWVDWGALDTGAGAAVMEATAAGNVVVAQGLGRIGSAVNDGQNLFGLSEHSLLRVSLQDGSVVDMADMSLPGAVAVDDSCVYWLNSSGLYSVDKSVNGPFEQQ